MKKFSCSQSFKLQTKKLFTKSNVNSEKLAVMIRIVKNYGKFIYNFFSSNYLFNRC